MNLSVLLSAGCQ